MELDVKYIELSQGKWKYLGLYTSELDAFAAYKRALKQLDTSIIKS